MYRFATNNPVDVDELRDRLLRMSDAQLLEFGKAARYICTPKGNLGRPLGEPFVIQLREARAEWRRRNNRSGTGLSNRLERSRRSGQNHLILTNPIHCSPDSADEELSATADSVILPHHVFKPVPELRLGITWRADL